MSTNEDYVAINALRNRLHRLQAVVYDIRMLVNELEYNASELVMRLLLGSQDRSRPYIAPFEVDSKDLPY